ncbi:MAG TPA: AarF/ABC1/UbiB kinase family protein [Gemmatimonadota bacterium]|nr:AarF/ABC1/UbiB kinase family protein [Gemmatimonadota bacterium]
MTLAEGVARLERFGEIARLLWKYGRSDLVEQAGIAPELREREPALGGEAPAGAEQLADDLEAMGPTFIKLGQILSTRADLLPAAYLQALARLQDRVEPLPFEVVQRTVEEELGVRIGKAFLTFDAEPLASASLGQVHAAALRDGRLVAVKVQRPGIRARIREDLEALDSVAALLDKHTEWGRRYHLEGMIREFGGSLARELDYRAEAANLEQLAGQLAEYDRLYVPQPIHDYTTERVLTMELVHGRKVTDISPMARLEMDGERLAEQLFEAYLKQILVDGRFHADPHPGNIFLTDDGRVALIDLGMMGRIPESMRGDLLRLVVAVGEGRGDEAARVARELGEVDEDLHDPSEYRRRVEDLVERYHGARVADLEVGSIVMEIANIAGSSGVRVPSELTMLGKTLLNLDAVGRALAPEFDPDASIRSKAAELLARRMRREFSPGNISNAALEIFDFLQHLPARANKILDRAAKNELAIRVEAIDERTLVEGFQKVANRIAMGLVLAALIVGAALLMQVRTSFTILGYPGLAILCFLGAACGGLALVGSILLGDRNDKRSSTPSRPGENRL